MPAGSPRRWGTASLALSLLGHGLVALVIVRLAPHRPHAPMADSVEISVVEAQPPATAGAPPARPTTETPKVRTRAAAPASSRPQPRSLPRPAPHVAPPPSEGLLRMRAEPDLSLNRQTYEALEGAGAYGDRPSLPDGRSQRRHAEETGSTAERVAKLLAPSGEDNVRAGRAHPQLFDYMRDAEKAFHPTLAQVERDGGHATVAGAFKALWQRYQEKLAENAENPPPRKREDEDTVELACEVCLTIRLGEESHIDLVRQSSSPDLDQSALEALRFAVDNRPANEPLVPAGGWPAGNQATRACYRFSASVRRLSPAALGCAFDEVSLKIGCVWPLKKVFRSRVTLLTVAPG